MIHSLAYTNCGTLCFADLELLPELLSPAEFEEAVDALYRLPAYRLRLRIFPDSDIKGLIAYWGKGTRDSKIRPLLESLAHIERPDGVSITIGAVLPDFARVRLNTFPRAWPEAETNREDCFWRSMNFFNSQPDMRYLDPAYVRGALRNEYSLVTGEPTFGDVVILANAAGDALHAAVFLAEDYVYTKNGNNMLSPWVIMKLSELPLVFPSEPPLRVAYFRRHAPVR